MERKLSITNLKKVSVSDSIIVQGKVAPCAKRFAINLGQDELNYLIHFNPRFDDNNVIVYNYKKDGKFGPEQRDFQFSFKQGQDTTITFNLNGNEVTVSYPGGHQFHYNSEVKLDHIEFVSVDGDFDVKSVNMK